MYWQEESQIGMDEFGGRLKRERSRVSLSQAEFAALGGVKQRAQFQYEKGMRRPNSDYLSALAVSGVGMSGTGSQGEGRAAGEQRGATDRRGIPATGRAQT
jgi:transcriptional regulator with XRE-family HTH domain